MPIYMVIGGISSGKSHFAEQLAINMHSTIKDSNLFYIATAPKTDKEMIAKIKKHQEKRIKSWITIEEEVKIYDRIREITKKNNVILIECITTWLSNILYHKNHLDNEIECLIKTLLKLDHNHYILVSNELGECIIPEKKIGREFQQLNGITNQKIAKISDNVYKITAGLHTQIK
tara:strand:+ start:21835 stop:22359 length:525 start_codon:yes stop_codon:yes gene_type:complete